MDGGNSIAQFGLVNCKEVQTQDLICGRRQVLHVFDGTLSPEGVFHSVQNVDGICAAMLRL